jgi:hypothetical protein
MLRHVIASGFGLSHDLLLQILGQPDRGLDVGRLAGFVAADRTSNTCELYPGGYNKSRMFAGRAATR